MAEHVVVHVDRSWSGSSLREGSMSAIVDALPLLCEAKKRWADLLALAEESRRTSQGWCAGETLELEEGASGDAS